MRQADAFNETEHGPRGGDDLNIIVAPDYAGLGSLTSWTFGRLRFPVTQRPAGSP